MGTRSCLHWSKKWSLASVGTKETPNVVQVLVDDTLRPHEVQNFVARSEPRIKWDVTALDDQGPCELNLYV